MDKLDIKVGAKLWYVPNRGNAAEVTVAKVGRKWFTVEERPTFRFSIEDGWEDCDYGRPGRCYSSREAYYKKDGCDRILNDLRRAIPIDAGDLTEADIRAAAKALRIELP